MEHDVALTNLDGPLFDGAEATKGDLVAYLDAVADRLLHGLRDRPLSVMRVRPGQRPFMQKNLPKSAPDWIETVAIWAETSKREVHYALCNDRSTLRWFANQRAVEYHPTLRGRSATTHLVLDLDPPAGAAFAVVAQTRAARARGARRARGSPARVKTSGAKGVHVFVPVVPDTAARRSRPPRARSPPARRRSTRRWRPRPTCVEEREGKVFVDATRAGGATVVAAYSPRIRPGVPVSFPVGWDELERVDPAAFTIKTAPALLGARDPWAEAHAGAAVPAGRPGRGRPRDPDRPRGRRCTRASAARPRATVEPIQRRRD